MLRGYVTYADASCSFLKHGLKFGRRNVLPLGLVVLERFDGLGGWLFLAMIICSRSPVAPWQTRSSC